MAKIKNLDYVIEEIARLYNKEKWNITSIAKHLNISATSVFKFIRSYNIAGPVKTYCKLTSQQKAFYCEVFGSWSNFLKYRLKNNLDLVKFYNLLQTENAPFVIRDEFYSLFVDEAHADILWTSFCDWWLEKTDNLSDEDFKKYKDLERRKKSKAGRPKHKLPDNFEEVAKRYIAKEIKLKEALTLLNMSHGTFYKYANELGYIKGIS